jgi:hypothetical protein
MKIKELISILTAYEESHGDLNVTVSCDQETHPEGQPQDDVICTILWQTEKDEPTNLMICDRFTYGELQA